MNIQKHIVTSSNWDTGRGGNKVSGIVLHTMVGTTASAQSRFNDPSSQVSVHYGVSLDGSITQWVEEPNTAYQAGNYAVNQKTIGIEHEDNGNANDSVRTAAEYESSSDLVADICRRYGISCDTSHIFLHKNVIDRSVYPGGTACPDGLDTNKIIAMAKAKLGGEDMADITNDGDIKRFYDANIGRQATPQEIAVHTGRDYHQMFDAIYDDPQRIEYRKFLIDQAFQGYLKRLPSPAEYDIWLNESVQDMFRGVKNSPEAIKKAGK